MNRYGDETIVEWRRRCDANAERLETSPHFVYRAFDSYGHLLYVGCTVNTTRRMSTHSSQSNWYPFAETVGVVEYPSRAAAREAEAAAIASEGAYFNATQADIQRTQANRIAAQRVGKSMHEMKAAYPYLDDRGRLDRYLAARDDAECARREAAA